VIRKNAWPFYRTISGVRLCWELEEPKGPNGLARLRVLLSSCGSQVAGGEWPYDIDTRVAVTSLLEVNGISLDQL